MGYAIYNMLQVSEDNSTQVQEKLFGQWKNCHLGKTVLKNVPQEVSFGDLDKYTKVLVEVFP